MDDDRTPQFPRPQHRGDGPWHGRATEAQALASAPDGGTHPRRPRHRGAGRRGALASVLAAALVVVGVTGYAVQSSAHSGGGRDVAQVAMAGDAPLAPSAAASAFPDASASPSASATPSASASASPHGPASAVVSPTARRTASKTPVAKQTATTSGGAAPVTNAPPATGRTAQFAQQVADLTNIERAKAGCGPLTVNAEAQTAAQVHSDDMVARHYFEHPDPEGHHADYRLRAAGYDAGSWGENIAYGQPDPAHVVDEWMHSPPHRENILNCDFKVIGVGVNFGANGPWWTQVFATPA